MYCQQCGAEVGDARFCRRCGAPSGAEALAMQRQAALAPVDYEKGFKKFFMGVAFLVIAIFPIFSHGIFWWWMLIPAVPLLAAGLGEFMRARQAASPYGRAANLSAEPSQVRASSEGAPLPPRARNTAELVPPPPHSITEGTTRPLNREKLSKD